MDISCTELRYEEGSILPSKRQKPPQGASVTFQKNRIRGNKKIIPPPKEKPKPPVR